MQESKSPESLLVSAPKKHSKKTKNGKAAHINADNLSKGRRSTMNSREKALEEEQFRLAVEASRREAGSTNAATSTQKGKRSRSDSEEWVFLSPRSLPFDNLTDILQAHGQSKTSANGFRLCILGFSKQESPPRTQRGRPGTEVRTIKEHTRSRRPQSKNQGNAGS